MRTLLLALLVALCGSAAAAPLSAQWPGQYGPRAQIWVENDRDYFRRGERLRVAFSTSADSYVAVVHVDPDGNMDFLFPVSPWDEQFVRAGRTYSLPYGGASHGLTVRGRGGIGYLYIIASPAPLNYGSFRAGGGSRGWDWSYAGRTVTGDPFWAMEQVTRMLIPDWGRVPFVVDYYGYHVDGPQRYPAYACSSWGSRDSYGYGWGRNDAWGSSFSSCDRLELFLRDNPYYFDTRRYSGDRRRLYSSYRESDPRHLYKEPAGQVGNRGGGQVRQPAVMPDRVQERVEPRQERPSTRGTERAPEPTRRATPERRAAPSTGQVAQPRASPPANRAPSATPRSRRPPDDS